MDSVRLEIEGMSCSHCVAKVREALGAVAGVQVGEVRLGEATVLFDRATTDIASLIDAVQDVGYDARETI